MDQHLQSVIDQAGRVDISFDAVGIPGTKLLGVPLVELEVERFSLPITTYTRSYFLTARLAARRMVANRSGVIMTVTTLQSRTGFPTAGGFGPAMAAREALTRELSAELAPHGIRVVGLRPQGMPGTDTLNEAFEPRAKASGMTLEQFQEVGASRTHTRRLSTLAELADMAAFIGGGVAGPVTAMALQRAGMDAVVYEAHAPTADEEVGSYLGVATNGIDALRAIDADKPVLAAGFPTPTNVLLSGTGRRLGAVSNGGRLPDGTVAHTIKRARLYRTLLQQAVDRGVAVQFGRRLVDAKATADGGVLARFDDGTQANGDLLVGADGIHSATRRLIDPAAPAGRYVGLVNFGGYTDQAAPDAEPGAWHLIFGRRAFFGYVVDPDGGTVWFANVPRAKVSQAERAATTAEQWQAQLADLFRGDRGPASDLIAAGRLELAADNTHDLPKVPTWHKGPMVIIGDAAHAPSPTSGQGASMAAEDAVVLAKCLRDLPDVSQALAAYEGLRRRRVERIAAQGARTGSAKTPGPAGRVLRDLLLPVVFRFVVTDRSQAWIYDHHLDWAASVELDSVTASA